MHVRTVLATLVAVVLLVSAQPAQALQISMGQVGLETFIVSEPGFPGTATVSVLNLSSVSEVWTPLVISDMSFQFFDGTGLLAAGILPDPLGAFESTSAQFQFPATQGFSSILFSGTIDPTSIIVNGNTFLANSLVTARILAGSGGVISPMDAAEIWIEGDFAASAVPEPCTLLLFASGGIFLARRKIRA